MPIPLLYQVRLYAEINFSTGGLEHFCLGSFYTILANFIRITITIESTHSLFHRQYSERHVSTIRLLVSKLVASKDTCRSLVHQNRHKGQTESNFVLWWVQQRKNKVTSFVDEFNHSIRLEVLRVEKLRLFLLKSRFINNKFPTITLKLFKLSINQIFINVIVNMGSFQRR